MDDLTRRALAGERDAAKQILGGILWHLHVGRQLPSIAVDYLLEAIPHILADVPADIALGLRTGDAGKPLPSKEATDWRYFIIRNRVRELRESGEAKSDTAAFKEMAKGTQFPDLTNPGTDISLSWTTIRDIYHGQK